MTMLGRMQRKLRLISSIDGAGKCLYHPPYSPVLSPCDFDFIPKMKEPLRGIHFRTAPETHQAVDRSIRTINTIGAAEGILQLSHLLQRVVHNAGYIEVHKYIEGHKNATCIFCISCIYIVSTITVSALVAFTAFNTVTLLSNEVSELFTRCFV
ncbi:hypothetical protein AVEN_11081-1 [Araneus ventricosus]|uniref:Tc1-like transposase DDE domain-containing protein n=1 Tax=Araneus ventricosus TaxID=182803 RepID=A0A4Y2TZP7_ARAVE|nr:hypothetical protein AVEN_11081-1 [Araneus ventricosus]